MNRVRTHVNGYNKLTGIRPRQKLACHPPIGDPVDTALRAQDVLEPVGSAKRVLRIDVLEAFQMQKWH
jgi:hypothetical protein